LIEIVLDTNVYWHNPAMNNLNFRALERLCKGNLVRLHIPYIVEREFQTQQREKYNNDLLKAGSALRSLSKKKLPANSGSQIQNIKTTLNAISEEILNSAEQYIIDWSKEVHAIRHPLCVDQAQEALEAYFQGLPPLNQPKEREDIPDSFLIRAIEKIHAKNNNLIVISGDKKVRKASSTINGISTYESLSSFIKSNEIQNEIKDLDLLDNLDEVKEAIVNYEGKSTKINQTIKSSVGEKVMWQTIHNAGVPDDNDEAIINSFGETEDIELNFDEMAFYGSGQLGIPFTLKMDVYANYYIFKSDYYCMNADEVPSVTDHNDHYFEAEDEFDICVSGLAKIKINRDLLNIKSLSDDAIIDSIEIDEIEDITLY